MKNSRRTVYALVLFGAVVLAWVVFVPVLNCLANTIGINHPKAWLARGTFGDTFGALNTLFTGLAFAAVLLSFIFQQQEIVDQSKQLSDQVKAQKDTALALTAQMKIMSTAAQLSAFPSIIAAQAELIKAMKGNLPPDTGSRSNEAQIEYLKAQNAITQEEKKFEELKKQILSLQDELRKMG